MSRTWPDQVRRLHAIYIKGMADGLKSAGEISDAEYSALLEAISDADSGTAYEPLGEVRTASLMLVDALSFPSKAGMITIGGVYFRKATMVCEWAIQHADEQEARRQAAFASLRVRLADGRVLEAVGEDPGVWTDETTHRRASEYRVGLIVSFEVAVDEDHWVPVRLRRPLADQS